jgi:subtilisin family serine protease
MVHRALVAIVVALTLGVTPAVADDSAVTPADSPPAGTSIPVPAPPDPAWQEPAESVITDPEDLVADSGDTGAMTVVYAVQDGDSLDIVTDRAKSSADAVETVAEVQGQPDVVAVDVDTDRQLTGMPSVVPPGVDPSRGQQWALDALQAESVWQASTGTGVTVAVLDSGVARHPDLAGSFVPGRDVVGGGDARTDLNGHGTHVAGIIAMTAGNGLGGAGLAPDVTIMPVIVADAGGSVRASDSAKGIIWAAKHGADVLNMSYSGSPSSVEAKALEYAQSRGVVAVAAAGNAYLDSRGSLYNPVQYPAAFPGVLGVGAVTKAMRRSSFSEVGKQVDVVAPGGSGAFDSARGIFSTYGTAGYVRMPGTSMAAPYVTATVALTLARSRALGLQANPIDVVLGSATDLGIPGRDDEFGFGLISPAGAMATLAQLQATGVASPVVTPSEVATRAVRKVRVNVRKGYLRYRIPAKGRFVVGWQRYTNRKWSDITRFDGKRRGRNWYTVRAAGGLKVRILAVRAGKQREKDPIWVSRTFRTRATANR